jgi:flagellar protein FliS
MYGSGSQHGLQQYRHGAVEVQVSEASPHRLVQLLFHGALTRLAAARGALQAGETARKGEFIGKTIAILEGLRISLDHQQGGAIAANLEDLYQYMERRLLEANARNDAGALTEVSALLQEIEAGWKAIEPMVAVGASAGAAAGTSR